MARWRWVLPRCVWLAAFLFSQAACCAEPERTLFTLDRADVIVESEGRVLRSGPMQLPLHWDVAYPGLYGDATLRMRFEALPAWLGSVEPFAIFIVRLGAAYEIRLNGVLLAHAGVMARLGDTWAAKQPVKVGFPAELLKSNNVLEIRLRADAGRRSGVSTLLVGPARQIDVVAARAELLRVTLPQAASVFSLLVAAFCALLWWQHSDPLYAWAGVGQTLWAVAIAHTLIEAAPLPWPAWGRVDGLVRVAFSYCLYQIVRYVFLTRPRAEQVAMAALFWCAPVVITVAASVKSQLPYQIYGAASAALWGVILAGLLWQLVHEPRWDRSLLCGAVLVGVVTGVFDSVAARRAAELYAEPLWAKYVASLVPVVIMVVVSMRFRQARRDVLQLNASLAKRVEQKEHELRDSFARLTEAERSRAVLAERERILRDMHDGVGASLATAVRQLESGQAQAGEVAQTLRESMDHLKLSIDAMSLPPGDVNALLASLRYRLQPRIESAGLTLDWQVEALPHWPAGDDEAMRHLQFLLLEAISNSLQHASAQRLTLSASSADGHITLALCDDGRGMAADAAGRGLRSMRERAAAIGAQLRVGPALPGTRVELSLGLVAKSAA